MCSVSFTSSKLVFDVWSLSNETKDSDSLQRSDSSVLPGADWFCWMFVCSRTDFVWSIDSWSSLNWGSRANRSWIMSTSTCSDVLRRSSAMNIDMNSAELRFVQIKPESLVSKQRRKQDWRISQTTSLVIFEPIWLSKSERKTWNQRTMHYCATFSMRTANIYLKNSHEDNFIVFWVSANETRVCHGQSNFVDCRCWVFTRVILKRKWIRVSLEEMAGRREFVDWNTYQAICDKFIDRIQSQTRDRTWYFIRANDFEKR